MATFDEVRNYLAAHGPIQLPYSTNDQIIFTAIADVCRKGQRKGHPIIRITSGIQTNILIYEKDWGNDRTTSGTLISHVFESLNPYVDQHKGNYMPQYNFRLRFHMPGQDCINVDAEELLILQDANGVVIRLHSGAKGTPIKNHSRASLIGGSYSSAAEAQSAAERTKRALLIWAVCNRVGIDLGGRPPRGVITHAGMQLLAKQIGSPVRSDVHGIDVYEHVDGLVFVSLNCDTSIGKGAGAFVEQVATAISTPVALSSKQELAGEILSASYFDASDRSRFVTRITAVEALLDPKLRSADAQQVVAKLLEVVEADELDESTRTAMSGSLSWLKRESIGQAGRALVARLLKGRVYEGQAPDQFFSFCYNLRSSILHFGKVPDEITNFQSVCAAAHQFVCDIMIASFAESS